MTNPAPYLEERQKPAWTDWVDRRPWVPILGLLAGVMAFWGHTLSFAFVWDDLFFVEHLESIRSLKNIPSMFYALDAQSSHAELFPLFRPLRTAHYAVLYWLGGTSTPNPWLFHLANVAWHAATTALLFCVLRELLPAHPIQASVRQPRETVAFLLALGFAVHPVLSEAVCWVKCLDDLMAAAFTLASTLCLLRWKPGSGDYRYGLAIGWFALGLYSKLSAIPLSIAVVLIFHQTKGLSLGASLRRTVPFVAVASAFMLHRHRVIGTTSQSNPLSGTYFQTLIDMLPTVQEYMRLALGIPPFSIDYSYLSGGHALSSAAVLLGATLCAGWAFGLFRTLGRPAWHLIGMGLMWTTLFLIPVSNVVPTMQYMAERFLYLPMIGVFIALGGLCSRPSVRSYLVPLAGGVIAVWSFAAWHRSWIWQDELTLFLRTSLEGQRSVRVEHNAVVAALRLPQMQRVFESVFVPNQPPQLVLRPETALQTADWEQVHQTLLMLNRVFPTNGSVLSALGFAATRRGHPEQAIAYLEEHTRWLPSDPRGWHNLGLAYSNAGRTSAAEASFRRALQTQPNHLPTLRSLTSLLLLGDRALEARELLIKLRNLDPTNPEHRTRLAEIDRRLGTTPPEPSQNPQ